MPARNNHTQNHGGPRLPGALRDQLGIKARPHTFKRPSGPLKSNSKPKRVGGPVRRSLEDEDDELPPPRLGYKQAVPTPSSFTTASIEPVVKKRKRSEGLDDERKMEQDQTLPSSSSSSSTRRKITASTSTPLSRLLSTSTPTSTSTATAKQTRTKSEKPVDPSIMRKSNRNKRELDEDEEIRWLEWKLGGGKKNGKGKGKGSEVDDEEDDGLDDLLNFADSIVPDGDIEMDEDEDEDDEDEDDDERDEDALSEDDMIGEEEEDDDLAQFWTDDEEEDDLSVPPPIPVMDSTTSKKSNKVDGEVKSVRFAGTDDEEEQIDGANGSTVKPAESSVIPTGGRYIPPHLRNKELQVVQSTKSDERIKLERKLQGLLNKLSEANIEAIFGDIEVLYRSNSRNDCTSAITDLIIHTISDKANLLDSFVVLHAALCAALYKVIGMEFGAHLVQTVITRYTSLSTSAISSTVLSDQAGKQPLNLLVLLSELYNFQVISCRIIYDIIRELIEGMSEKSAEAGEFSVEALLKILRCSGPQLRTDDSGSLKEIVHLVQGKTAGMENSMSARSKFMTETLVNLKNSKNKAVPGAEAGAEATRRMKKYLGGLQKKRTILVHEPLRISLADIRSADTRGKWWLVGAAWGGDPLAERAQEKQNKQHKAPAKNSQDDDLGMLGANDVEALVKLARKQGMNTDVRRSVFVIMMSSEDFRHASQRLSQLKFTEVQQREFVRVALHCLGVEPTYNPYYTLILCTLCTDSYSHRFTLQYAIWDLLRDMGQVEVGGAAITEAMSSFDGDSDKVSKSKAQNVAKALAWTIAKGGADLTIFKAVDFVSLETRTKTFFRTFFPHLCIALHTSSPVFKLPKQVDRLDEDVEELFSKTLGNSNLAQGLAYFMTKDMGVKALAELDDAQSKLVEDCLKIARNVLARAV